jgi:hypothetical protein
MNLRGVTNLDNLVTDKNSDLLAEHHYILNRWINYLHICGPVVRIPGC